MVVVMRTEKKVSEETVTEGQKMPCQCQCNGRLSAVTLPSSFSRQAADPPAATGLAWSTEAGLAATPGLTRRHSGNTNTRIKQRLKILRLRFGERVVLIRWLHSGQRLEETVPFQRARHRRAELEAQGAVVYWSERLVHHG